MFLKALIKSFQNQVSLLDLEQVVKDAVDCYTEPASARVCALSSRLNECLLNNNFVGRGRTLAN